MLIPIHISRERRGFRTVNVNHRMYGFVKGPHDEERSWGKRIVKKRGTPIKQISLDLLVYRQTGERKAVI
ncbi:hypothetical protein RRF57_002750 [Xylaria bambusicola]|uniref:Uncharacterized protein n=1 Tax=Xylaria bambusicola TaxID=326684 RepID=A0AAN7YVW0_9PEZI